LTTLTPRGLRVLDSRITRQPISAERQAEVPEIYEFRGVKAERHLPLIKPAAAVERDTLAVNRFPFRRLP